MWEASHSERIAAAAADVWALWADPARWPDWNEQLESAELDGELAVGATVRAKLRRGGRMEFTIVALEQERLLISEARMPGARLGHEQRLNPGRRGVEVTHRLYVRGPLSGLFALLLGRKRMRERVETFAERERRLAEPRAKHPKSAKRQRRSRR